MKSRTLRSDVDRGTAAQAWEYDGIAVVEIGHGPHEDLLSRDCGRTASTDCLWTVSVRPRPVTSACRQLPHKNRTTSAGNVRVKTNRGRPPLPVGGWYGTTPPVFVAAERSADRLWYGTTDPFGTRLTPLPAMPFRLLEQAAGPS
jgi:hypothetical protein